MVMCSGACHFIGRFLWLGVIHTVSDGLGEASTCTTEAIMVCIFLGLKLWPLDVTVTDRP